MRLPAGFVSASKLIGLQAKGSFPSLTTSHDRVLCGKTEREGMERERFCSAGICKIRGDGILIRTDDVCDVVVRVRSGGGEVTVSVR